MKVKVVNNLSDYFGEVYDVKSLNYKYILGLLPGTTKKIMIPFEDAEFVFEHEWEKNIVKYRDILKISLPKSVSIKFYGAICYVLEQYFKGEIKSISVLRDIDEKVRKNYWYKSIEIVINDSCPASVTASGREYTDKYNIDIEDIDINSFVYECRNGICNLKELIRRSADKIRQYEKAINNLEGDRAGRYQFKAIEGKVTPL